VEPIKKFFSNLRNDPVMTIRYILVVAGIFVTFQNLFDCITQDAELYEYFFYVMTMGAITISLIFIPHNSVVCLVLALSGVLAIYDSDPTASPSVPGIAFLMFSKRIANSLIFSFLIYCITALAIVANSTFRGKTPADSVNVIVGYYAVYLIDYILEGVHKEL